MKSIIYQLTAPRTLVANSVEIDSKSLNASELLAATEYTVVSPGTELAAWLGKPPLRPMQVYPRLIGYCNVARVLEVGSGIEDIRVGDRILTHQSHRSNFRCARSDVLLSVSGISDELSRKLATTYLYHLGYVALLSGCYVPGCEVAIVGLGALGLTTANLTLAFGGEPVIFSDQTQSTVGSGLAGVRVLPKTAPAPEQWQSRSGLEGFDLVINTSDAWSDYQLSLILARKGGALALLGFPGRNEALPDFNPLDARYLYDKQLLIRQVGYVTETAVAPIDVRFTLQRNLSYLFGLIRRNAVDPSPLLALHFNWRELREAYEGLTERRPGAYSALIDWTC